MANQHQELGVIMGIRWVACLCLVVGLSTSAHADDKLETVDCRSLVGLPSEAPATCGYLHVPQDRAHPQGRTIAVPFVHAHARRQPALPDPVFVIPGGPGERAFYPDYLQYQPALETRDVVWIDQRGTELARPALQCPEYEQATQRALRGLVDADELASSQIRAARTCAARARSQGIDLRHYSSRDIAQDIDDLRTALGFKQVNVYAISYGGRIASTLIRLHPESVRALVLNSPLPIEANYDEFGSVNMQRTLDMIFAGCSADPSCSHAFPRVRSQFQELITKAKQSPTTISLESAGSPASTVTVRVTDWVLANAILSQLYSPYGFELLPRRLDAMSRGDESAFKSVVGVEPSRNALLQRLAVWCNDEYGFESVPAIQKQRTAFPLFAGVDQSTVPIGACEAAGLGRSDADGSENAPIATQTPVLIFAGEYDPTIPPSWLRSMASNMPHALIAVFPGQGHGAGFNQCGWTMMRSFIDAPVGNVDASCLLKERSPDFARSLKP